jgi:hypothetical protein
MGRILFISLVFFSFGCNEVDSLKRYVDYASFKAMGGTLFSDPNKVTTKEIHFDSGRLLGREVILEGQVLSYGKFDTYLVLSDESGRMLVVLTHLVGADSEVEDTIKRQQNKSVLRVLGSVERGKKGLPYLLARSVTFSNGRGTVE